MAEGRPLRHAHGARHQRLSRRPRWIGIVTQVIAWVIASVMIGLILALVVVPRVTGSTPYTVLTGSMVPRMPPGTMVVVRPLPFDQIRVGDVVTYQLESGKPAVVTHRVVAIDVGDDGVLLRTQGDANPTPDQEPVHSEQVRGKVWYWVPLVGYLGTVASGGERADITRLIGAILIGYALCVVIAAIVRRRRTRSAESTTGLSEPADRADPR